MFNQTRSHVLYLVHRFPYPPDKGDRIRAFHIIDYLRSRCDLTVVTFDDSGVSVADRRALAGYCDRLEVIRAERGRAARGLWRLGRGGCATLGAFQSKSFGDAVRRIARESPPEAVLLSSSGLADYLKVPELRPARTVVDFVDLDSQKWRDYASQCQGPRRWIYRAEAERLRAVETKLIGGVDAITLVTDAERRLCLEHCGAGPIHTVTNGVRAGARPVALPRQVSLIFVGALDYRPNVAGVHWFCKNVWPAIHKRHPEVVLRLVGRAPHRSITQLKVPGVDVVGPVPEIRPYLDAATISISPLQIARGLQNKVLEAMAAGRPVVASAGAAQGLMALPGHDLLVADSSAEWIATLNALIEDPARQNELGRAGRAYIERAHDWSTCLNKLPDLLGLESKTDIPMRPTPVASHV